MNAADLIREAVETGATIRLDGGAVMVGRASPQLLARLREHKPELVAFLHAARETTDKLLTAAMRACDHWQDGPAAREQMRRECLDTPLHLRAGLLAHFDRAHPASPDE